MQTDNIGAPFGLTPEQQPVATKVSRATWAGLAISLFAMVAIRQAFVFFLPEITFGAAVLKEALIWLNALALIVIIRRGEHLPMRSIGLGTARWWKSILWGFVLAAWWISLLTFCRNCFPDRMRLDIRLRLQRLLGLLPESAGGTDASPMSLLFVTGLAKRNRVIQMLSAIHYRFLGPNSR